jgi:serine/threonine protein phosphatase PrpC
MEQVSLVAEDAGSTGVVAILQGSSLTVAHAGDSRATLRRRGMNTQITSDHSPNRDDEAKRIQRAGGKVFFGRVNGRLAVWFLLAAHASMPLLVPASWFHLTLIGSHAGLSGFRR